MAIHTGTWPNGVPCWVDCSYQQAHRGLHHAKDFYGRLFGWRVVDSDDDYAICLKDDHPAAGITLTQDENAPTVWNTYLAVDDVDTFVQRVAQAGGQVILPPQEVGASGRRAFCNDPTGAVFGLWQGGEHPGFGISGEAGTVAWSTLLTKDLDAARAFYAEVFGYTYVDADEYGVVAALPDGTRICSIHLADQLPDDASASWLPHFGVADRDSSAQLAQELDGFILMTFDSPMGPEAIIQAKHGEVFGIVEVEEA